MAQSDLQEFSYSLNTFLLTLLCLEMDEERPSLRCIPLVVVRRHVSSGATGSCKHKESSVFLPYCWYDLKNKSFFVEDEKNDSYKSFSCNFPHSK